MMASSNEIALTVPAPFVRKCSGLSIDFGASVVKIVYRSAANLDEAQSSKSENGHLQLVSFARPDFQAGLDYIKKHADLLQNDRKEPADILTTGVGCTQFGKTICERLNIKIQNVTEFDCFVKAFVYLATSVSRTDLFEAYDIAAGMKPFEAFREAMEMMASMAKDGQTGGLNVNVGFDPMCALGQTISDSPRPVAEVEEDLYPCMLAMCGSGFGFFVVNKDGTFKVVDASNRGGRTFFGLGSLLTGVKDYRELVDLASKGNQQNVDMFNNALFSNQDAAEGEDTLYTRSAELQQPTLVYCFGKCVGANKDDFKREDLAHALLNHYVLDLVQTLSLISANAGVKRVVFCGSFVNEPFVRSMITEEYVKRNMFCQMFGMPIAKFDFLRPGSYLGAIGALVTQYEQKEGVGGAKA